LQTALTLVLLVEAGLMLRTFSPLRHTDPGFDVDHLVAFTLVPEIAGPNAHTGSTLPPGLSQDLLQRVQQLPGVRSASVAGAALMERIGFKTSAALTGQTIVQSAFLNTSLNKVSGKFFETMGMPILNGRAFTDTDANTESPAPAVINEAFARTFFPSQNPIGKTFGNGAPGETAKADNRVVGIVGDSKYRSLREPLLSIFYSPMRCAPMKEPSSFTYVPRDLQKPSSLPYAIPSLSSTRVCPSPRSPPCNSRSPNRSGRNVCSPSLLRYSPPSRY
jgi:hypothetical protein